VVASMMFDAGFSSDKFGGQLGLASISMSMLMEGTKTKNALEINEQLQLLGASMNASNDLDYSYITLNTLRQNLDKSLDLMADVALNPAFPEADFKRLQDQQISGIQNEKKQPRSMVMRIAPTLLYGEDHPYAMPMSGLGEEETVRNLTTKNIRDFYSRWMKPNNATIVVTGDISMTELVNALESRFGSWTKGTTPKKEIPVVSAKNNGKIFVIDRPESPQTMIYSGYLIDKYGSVDENALDQVNNVLGGDFTSRINMNIREDKHWSYGVRSFVQNTKGQRPFLIMAPVQTDKTKESVQEITKEISSFITDKQMTEAEFDKTKQNTVMGMAGMWETNAAVNGSARSLLRYGLSDSYWNDYAKSVQKLSLNDTKTVAKKVLQPSNLSWFMAGSADKILPGLSELGMEIILIDANGNLVKKKNP